MKDIGELFTAYGLVIGLIIIAIIVIALVGIGLQFMDVSMSKQIIEHSKSYIDSRNEKAAVLIQQYEGASESQKVYLKTETCQLYDELGKDASKLLVRFATQNCP